MKTIITILAAFAVLCLAGCGNNGKRVSATDKDMADIPTVQYAEQITIDKLPEVLERLKNGQSDYDFLGICSRPEACIYFMQDGGKFYIDYEAIALEQRPYLERIRKYASKQGFRVVETTYGNTPIDYDDMAQAPVLSLRIDTDIDSIAVVGKKLMHDIFQNNDSTLYDVVP